MPVTWKMSLLSTQTNLKSKKTNQQQKSHFVALSLRTLINGTFWDRTMKVFFWRDQKLKRTLLYQKRGFLILNINRNYVNQEKQIITKRPWTLQVLGQQTVKLMLKNLITMIQSWTQKVAWTSALWITMLSSKIRSWKSKHVWKVLPYQTLRRVSIPSCQTKLVLQETTKEMLSLKLRTRTLSSRNSSLIQEIHIEARRQVQRMIIRSKETNHLSSISLQRLSAMPLKSLER